MTFGRWTVALSLVLSITLLCITVDAHAWFSDGHQRLTQLLEGAYAAQVPTIFNSQCWTMRWGTGYDGRYVESWVQLPCIRIGSDDPDRYRSRTDEPVGNAARQISHYLEGNARGRMAFCAAVRSALQGGEKDAFAVKTHVPPNDRYAIAGYRMGMAFHYMQDMADPTKDILSSFNRRIVRTRMENQLYRALQQPQSFWVQIAPSDSAVVNLNLEQLLDYVNGQRNQSYSILTQYLSRIFTTPMTHEIDQQIDIQTWRMSLVAVAAQRRMTALFDAHMRAKVVCDTKLNPWGYPPNIGEFTLPTPTVPPPSAPRPPGMPSDDPWEGLIRR